MTLASFTRVLTLTVVATSALAAQASPQAAVDALLAADRAFSSASAGRPFADAAADMMSDDVVMPTPPGRFARGKAEAIAALRANPDNVTGSATWTPVRGGLSADGQQGYTFGFMTLTRADGTTLPLKYMTYWKKTAAGWRAAAYKRARRPDGAIDLSVWPPTLPAALVAPITGGTPAALTSSLTAAEKAFSDEAQKIGLGPAFAKYGATDAANMGGASNANYVKGASEIAKLVGDGLPTDSSPVEWSCEWPIVATSGDLGVSIGFIRSTDKSVAQPPSPFFTIWSKVGGVWKYIAE